MASKIGIRAHFIQLDPVDPTDVPNGAFFLDSSNADVGTIKSTGGSPAPVGDTSSMFIKQMQASGAIPVNRPISKRPDGKIEEADSDAAEGQEVCGFNLQAALADGDLVNVLCIGANLAGALTGLGYAPGDEVYLSEDGLGYTNNPNSFTGNNDSIIRLGIADCAAGVASTTVADLLVFTEVIARP